MKTILFVLLSVLLFLSFLICICSAAVMVIPSTPAKGSSIVTGGPTDAIAWYKLDNDLTDASASGNNLTGNNSPTFTTGQDGIANHAISFNGSNQNATKSSPANLPTGDVSFSAWVFPTTGSGAHTICCLGNSTATSSANWSDLYFEIGSGTLGVFQFQSGSFSASSATPAIVVSAWTHVAMAFHSATGSTDVYTNGVLAFTQSIASGFPSGIDTISIGAFVAGAADPYLNYFQGNIDDVRIFARALSATEAANLYAGQSARYRTRPDFYLAFELNPNLP